MNSNQIKLIVIILMLFDHLSYFLPQNSSLGFVIGFISRLTAPTMALCIAEGYYYTRNVNNYMKRMFIFALISYIPYCLYRTGYLIPFQLFDGNITPVFFRPNGAIVNEPFIFLSSINSTLVIHQTSVIFTLFLGLFTIYLWDKIDISKYLKIIITCIILWLSAFANWQFYLVLLCLIFYFLKNNVKKMWILYFIISLLYIFDITLFSNPFNLHFTWDFIAFRIGIFLVPLFFMLYNGKPGNKSKFNKWFFYIFYPGHLLIIGIIRLILHC